MDSSHPIKLKVNVQLKFTILLVLIPIYPLLFSVTIMSEKRWAIEISGDFSCLLHQKW